MQDKYSFLPQHLFTVVSARKLLNKIAESSLATPAKMVSISKLIHVFSMLPKTTDNVYVTLDLIGPRRWFGEHEIYHAWQIQVEPDCISISVGGHFYRQSTGGDSFTCMYFTASSGCDSDLSDMMSSCQIVDDLQPFDVEVRQIDLSEDGYSLDIYDEDNPLLDEEDLDDDTEDDDWDDQDEDEEDLDSEDGDDWANAQPISSSDAIENSLSEMSDEATGFAKKIFGHFQEKTCSFCKTDLSSKKYLVDGKMKGSFMWALMCARCFYFEGEGVGWGKGQLYTRLTNGKWLMTAGFPAEE